MSEAEIMEQAAAMPMGADKKGRRFKIVLQCFEMGTGEAVVEKSQNVVEFTDDELDSSPPALMIARKARAAIEAIAYFIAIRTGMQAEHTAKLDAFIAALEAGRSPAALVREAVREQEAGRV